MNEKRLHQTDSESAIVQHLAMPDGDVLLYPLTFPDHNSLFQTLLATTPWQQHVLTLYGRPIAAPRLSAWYGDKGAVYSYSGLRLEPLAWNATLLKIKYNLDELAGVSFNSVLMNLYRDGKDSMGWHSDAESELGKNPVIASVSLGVVRRFNFQHKKRPIRIALDLEPGSTLIMKGATQHYWRHNLPKTRKAVGPRINLTFRRIMSLQ